MIRPMTIPREALQTPLTFDAQIITRLTEIVGSLTSRRQLWIIPLDSTGRQLPLVMPIDGIPARPPTRMLHNLLVLLRDAFGASGAESVIYALQRTGSAEVTADDLAWAHAIRRQGKVSGLAVRGVYLCSTAGVSALPGSREATVHATG